MKHKNISIFIPHAGCRQMCSFCDQRTIAGQIKPPTFDEVKAIISKAYEEINDKSTTEIAFFGGSFTAIPKDMMISYLNVAKEFVGNKGFYGIRISTRPDAIDNDILNILKLYHVTAIELGAQSMNDDVLSANNRGHSSQTVVSAGKLIKQFGFSLGLQMMVGLYKSTPKLDEETAKAIIKCSPDTVRIYPTVILKGTKLEELLLKGEYIPFSFESSVKLCSKLLVMFEKAGIDVIKLGLHASESVESEMVGGIYHPAFKELCESEIFFEKAILELKHIKSKTALIMVSRKSLSKMIGQQKSNLKKLSSMGYNIKILTDDNIEKYDLIIKEV